jgi:uncharacterized Zn-finger protein
MADQPEPPEIIEVDTVTVSCDGGPPGHPLGHPPGHPPGHPKVYLSVDGKGTVDCPYCDRRFVLKPGAAGAGH